MKINRHLRSLLSGLCLLLLTALAPAVPAVALGGGASNTAFCGTLSNRANAFQTRFSTKQTALTTAWQHQTAKLQALIQNQDTAVTKLRAQTDEQRSANQAALLAKAKTATQQAAVAAYTDTITNAVHARRSAVDTARASFRTGVKTLLTNRQAAASGQVTAFKIAVSDAYTTGANSCTDNTDGATVRAAILQSIATARQTFESQRTSDTTKADLQTLITARNQAVQTANTTFLQSAQAARDSLRDAYGSDI
jgi:hypothetical protein